MAEVPDSTAARTALWRARHTELDAAPHVVDDVVGLRLLDLDAGFADARHVPGSALDERYFADRHDGLHPARGEDFLVATT